LSDNIDNLENTMEPVLSKDLSEQIVGLGTSLEEAKLCTLLAYSLQSILFGKSRTVFCASCYLH
jgi:hypothetical protein